MEYTPCQSATASEPRLLKGVLGHSPHVNAGNSSSAALTGRRPRQPRLVQAWGPIPDACRGLSLSQCEVVRSALASSYGELASCGAPEQPKTLHAEQEPRNLPNSHRSCQRQLRSHRTVLAVLGRPGEAASLRARGLSACGSHHGIDTGDLNGPMYAMIAPFRWPGRVAVKTESWSTYVPYTLHTADGLFLSSRGRATNPCSRSPVTTRFLRWSLLSASSVCQVAPVKR